MKPKRRFAFTIDIWDDVADDIIKHVASGASSRSAGARAIAPVARAIGVKSKNPAAPAVKREAEEDGGREKWR
jgi:hypothetical protein